MTEKNILNQPKITPFPGNPFSTSLGQDKSGLALGQTEAQPQSSSSRETEGIVNRLIVYFKKNQK